MGEGVASVEGVAREDDSMGRVWQGEGDIMGEGLAMVEDWRAR